MSYGSFFGTIKLQTAIGLIGPMGPISLIILRMLSKVNRLQKKNDFQKVFKNSRPAHSEYFSIRAVKNNRGDNRFGFIISNKIDKRATRRNALKRQLREIVKSLILGFPIGYDVVVIVKKNFEYPCKQPKIREELKESFKRAGLL